MCTCVYVYGCAYVCIVGKVLNFFRPVHKVRPKKLLWFNAKNYIFDIYMGEKKKGIF
jgi:hypothetical protein